jgi:flagellar assembly protein FliH
LSRIIKSPTISDEVYHISSELMRERQKDTGNAPEKGEEDEALRLKALEARIIEQGQQKAAEIVQKAEKEKDRLVAEAKKQADQLQRQTIEQALSQGRQEGLERGTEEGRKLGLQEFEGKIKEFEEKSNQLLDSMQNEKSRLIRKHERALVELACEIAGRIVRKKIEEDNETIRRVVEAALERATEKERLVVRLNPNDYEWLHEHADDLKHPHEEIKEILFESDRRVEAGGCVIETIQGNVDARLERQLEEMRRGLEEE